MSKEKRPCDKRNHTKVFSAVRRPIYDVLKKWHWDGTDAGLVRLANSADRLARAITHSEKFNISVKRSA